MEGWRGRGMGGLGNKFDAKFEVVYNKNMKNKMIIQQ